MAFSRLWGPRSRISSGLSGSSAGSPKVTRRPVPAAPAPAAPPRLIRLLVAKQPQLGLAVGVERAVPVEVVLLEVQQQCGVGRQRLRVLGLEARDLATTVASRPDRSPSSGQRRAHVARHGHRQAGCAPHGAEQLDGGGLAVVAVTATSRWATGARPAPARQARAARAHGRRRSPGRRPARRALHDERDPVEQLHPVTLEVGLHALGHVRPGPVGGEHRAVGQQHARRRGARAGQAHDQIGTLGEGGPHVIEA